MSIVNIYDLNVIFPYAKIYPEQKEYMGQIKLSFDSNGPAVLEIPSGTGRRIAMFSLLTAYMEVNPGFGPLVFSSHSLPQINEAINDLKIVCDCRRQTSETDFNKNFTAIPFGNRTFYCINPSFENDVDIPKKCIDATVDWTIEGCSYYHSPPPTLKPGVYSLQEFKDFANEVFNCPFFLAKRLCTKCNAIFCSYEDLINPAGGYFLRSVLPETSIIIYDNAQEIDTECCNALSYYITKKSISEAQAALKSTKSYYDRIKDKEQALLQDAYNRLKEGVTLEKFSNAVPENSDIFLHPVIQEHQSKRCIPGTFRRYEFLYDRINHLLHFVNALFDYYTEPTPIGSPYLLTRIKEKTFIDPETLHFLHTAFSYYAIKLKFPNLSKFFSLFNILKFFAVVSTYDYNIDIFFELKNTDFAITDTRALQVACYDSSIAFSQVLKYKRFLITAETMSPLSFYNQLLNFDLISMVDFSLAYSRKNFLPIIITRGCDQSSLSTMNDLKANLSVINNFGNLISDIARIVPDGIVCFFPSFSFMHELTKMWNESQVLNKILNYKLLFIEPQTPEQVSLVVDNYKRACDNGRGAIFLGVADGYAVKSCDFSNHYGRCSIVFGLPEPQKQVPVVKMRAEFLDRRYNIAKEEFMLFNSIRIASQCAATLLKSKSDYSVALFADARFGRPNARIKFPRWIQDFITKDQAFQSIEDAVEQVKSFFLKMGQPYQPSETAIVPTSSE